MTDRLFRGDLSGKVAVVTGAAQGIGEAIANRLATWSVAGLVLVDRQENPGRTVAEALAKAGWATLFVHADLAVPEAAEAVIAATDQRFGRLDCLVNAAGITDRGSLLDADLALWERSFAINARAPFLLMQGAARLMRRERQGGGIVNIISINAHCGAPDLAVYSASKGALATLTRNAANALRADRIRVNGINLGWTDTPTEDRVQRAEHPAGEMWRQAAQTAQPFGRLITPDDVADLTAFLLSPHSGVMTGAILDYEQWIVGAPPPKTTQ